MSIGRWLKWEPKTRAMEKVPESEPSKPSKPGFVGFEGASPAESPEIEAGQNPAELAQASGVLSRAGVRLMDLDGVPTIGIWSDLDGPEIRAALRTLESDRLPVRYLDGAGIPMQYKVRRVEGEPVPMNVLNEMERQPEEPLKVRERMLKELGRYTKGIAWGRGRPRN